MADAMMANPDLRHPFEATAIHPPGSATVLYQGRTIVLSQVGDGAGLLVRAADLTRINGFELKPQGACFDDLCIPLTDAMTVERGGESWFDVTALADVLGQPYVADSESNVWSFGEVPAKRDNMMQGAMAPEFEVTDRQGNLVTLADLKGKKALIVTWSSW